MTVETSPPPPQLLNVPNVLTAMRLALEDSGSEALVLLINSPGGSPVQAGLINDEIGRLRALHNKPIYAVVEESCASAAYYIAAAADKIYVDKASIVGSIGVLMDGFGFTELMNKLGVERRLMTAGTNKGFLDPFSPQTEPQRKHAQAMLDQVRGQSLDAPLVTTLALEREVNTFFRLGQASVIDTLRQVFPHLSAQTDEETVFVKLRELRNTW